MYKVIFPSAFSGNVHLSMACLTECVVRLLKSFLIGEKWYLTVVLSSISCVVSELQNIFTCLGPFLIIKNRMLGFLILKLLENLGKVGQYPQAHQRILS